MHTARWPRQPGRSAGARRGWQLLAVGAAALALAAAGCSSSGGGSSNGKITITELDYFTSSGGNAAVNWYNKQFEKAHPNVTVKREVVPYANLITKVLQEASAGDLPNIVMLDNPNVPEVAATGQLKPLNGLPGFTTSGYVPGAISECTFQGKQYCYPDWHQHGRHLLQQGHVRGRAHVPADHLGSAAVRREGPDQGERPRHRVRRDRGRAVHLAARAVLLERRRQPCKGEFPAFTQSLQLWVNMVKDGSASKSVLQWGQDPDLTQQFLHQSAAMIEDGPWIFPELNAAGWKYNDQYGIVPIPTQKAGQTVVTPLGGETWNIGNSGSSEQQNMAWQWIKGAQVPSVMKHITGLMYYLPTKPAVTAQYLKGGPEYTVFAHETATSRSRTTQYGANYPKVSQAIWTAIQSAITGTASAQSALNTAQGTVSGVQQVSSGG